MTFWTFVFYTYNMIFYILLLSYIIFADVKVRWVLALQVPMLRSNKIQNKQNSGWHNRIGGVNNMPVIRRERFLFTSFDLSDLKTTTHGLGKLAALSATMKTLKNFSSGMMYLFRQRVSQKINTDMSIWAISTYVSFHSQWIVSGADATMARWILQFPQIAFCRWRLFPVLSGWMWEGRWVVEWRVNPCH